MQSRSIRRSGQPTCAIALSNASYWPGPIEYAICWCGNGPSWSMPCGHMRKVAKLSAIKIIEEFAIFAGSLSVSPPSVWAFALSVDFAQLLPRGWPLWSLSRAREARLTPLSRSPELPCLPCAVIFAAWDPTRLNSGPPTAPAMVKGWHLSAACRALVPCLSFTPTAARRADTSRRVKPSRTSGGPPDAKMNCDICCPVAIGWKADLARTPRNCREWP